MHGSQSRALSVWNGAGEEAASTCIRRLGTRGVSLALHSPSMPSHEYTYDHVLGEDATQEALFASECPAGLSALCSLAPFPPQLGSCDSLL